MDNNESITLPPELLIKYSSDYFVETGSFYGGAIQTAINAGFSDIHGIEIDPTLFLHCQSKFEYDVRVTMHLGDSLKVLPEILSGIDDRITFWLDAHYGNSPTQGDDPTPLLREIGIIGTHPRKDHILLIDDVRLFGKSGWEKITRLAVVEAILRINPEYTIVYEDSKGYTEDIMVAYIENKDD